MAVTISDTTWSGFAASPIITKAATEFDSVNKGVIYVADSIRKVLTIPRFVMTSLIQDRQATPTSAGTGTIDGRTLTPADAMVYWEFNPRDFETHFEAENLSDQLLQRTVSPTLQAVILGEVNKFVNSYMDYAVWQSRTSNTSSYKYYNGFVKKMLLDSDVVDVASAVALTSSNIEAKLNLVKDSIPDSIYNHPDLKYIVNIKTAKYWADAQRTASFKGAAMTDGGVMMFDGKPVVAVAGLHDDTIICTRASNSPSSNLWLGVNSKSDEASVQIDFLQANSEIMFFKMLFKADVQHGFGSEIVMYTTQS